MKILHIDASDSHQSESHTRGLSATVVEHLIQKFPDAVVDYLDVNALALPHVGVNIRGAWAADTERDPSLDELASRSKALVQQLQESDVMVIGSPMYNFTVPSTLKAWIDHVAIAGQTFRYSEQGPVGLLGGKTAYLALSSGGIYSEGPAKAADHLDTYLRTVLAFMGVEDVHTVRAEGTALGPDSAKAAMANAHAAIQSLIH
jgi:FMN-dependent NADH-azoreductase